MVVLDALGPSRALSPVVPPSLAAGIRHSRAGGFVLDKKEERPGAAAPLEHSLRRRCGCRHRKKAMSQSTYTFGDSDRAAARLELLAEVYEPTSRSFLGAWCPTASETALDMGCGPGYTTYLLHEVGCARETWGLDASTRLVDLARARFGPPLRFAVHDVTAPELPQSGFGIAYARFLLTHLASPQDVLRTVAGGCLPGGRMLLEETAALESPDATFATYYTHVRALQRHYGQDTFVGAALDRLPGGTPWTLEHFELRRVTLNARAMAKLHVMNLETWSTDPFAVSAFDARLLASLGEALGAVATGERDAPPVSVLLGQAVLRR
jgi:SAM-dependent methyltransferase